MIRGVKIYILAAIALLFIAGCAKQRTLSDGQLALIFHDAFLANAYSTNKGINLDSLRLYEPIFNKYGYTVEDVQHTIGSFSIRKSARLSDVVEAAIKLLEREGEVLDYEVRVLDTLNSMAVRRTTELIHKDSLIWIKDFRDTTQLRLTFEQPKSGSYSIDFDYLVSSDDTTPKGHRTLRWVEVKPKPKKSNKVAESKSKDESKDEVKDEVKQFSSTILNRGRVVNYSSSIFVDNNVERLEIIIARAVAVDGEPDIKIKNLTIKRVLPTLTAVDSLYRELLPLNIFDDELLFTTSSPSR